MRLLGKILSLGQSDAIPDRLSRQVRVTNALSLLGVVLSCLGIPLDLAAGGTSVVAGDLVAAAVFALSLFCNARGFRTASRVLLAIGANGVMFHGTMDLGGATELRTVFFAMVILPFLVFSTTERGLLITFVLFPIAAYFVTGAMEHPLTPGRAGSIYRVYAPALSFALTVGGTYLFVYIERSAEEKLRAAQVRAAKGARLVALGEMASGIAHEIRNPLAAINLAATQIADRPDAPALVAQLGLRIRRIVMRASRIIDALRSFSRDAGGDPFVATPVERIIGDTLDLCAKRFADHGVALTVGPVPPELALECRSVQLSQVLVNLLGNAYDAVASSDTSAERWVRIDVRADGDQVDISVTDSGPGVPTDAHARIFEPFFTTKEPDRGTGLGLSLSRSFVEAHRGRLYLDTQSRHTRFVVQLPRTLDARSSG